MRGCFSEAVVQVGEVGDGGCDGEGGGEEFRVRD